MNLTAAEIATQLGGTLEGPGETVVSGIGGIDNCKPGDITFFQDPRYEAKLYQTQAAVVILRHDYQPTGPLAASLIRVSEPYLAFKQLLEAMAAELPKRRGIEPGAYIDPSAELGEDLYIGAGAYISPGVRLGRGVWVYPGVYLGDNVRVGEGTILYPNSVVYYNSVIGARCIIHAGAVVGADGFGYLPDAQGRFFKVPQIGNVVLEDDVEIGANTCIDRSTMGTTWIRQGAKIDNLVQVAHNCDIGAHTGMAAQSGVAGSTRVGRHCQIGGQSGLTGHITVADQTGIGAQSGVSKSILQPGQVFFGSPAQPLKDELRQTASLRTLPDLLKKVQELERKLNEIEQFAKPSDLLLTEEESRR
jgi:UDP-3-O-[3-hydroxymyristoyl] glucosamine N-acyltransferase